MSNSSPLSGTSPVREPSAYYFKQSRVEAIYEPLTHKFTELLYAGDPGYFLLSFHGILFFLLKVARRCARASPGGLSFRFNCPDSCKLGTYALAYKRWALSNPASANLVRRLCTWNPETKSWELLWNFQQGIVEARSALAANASTADAASCLLQRLNQPEPVSPLTSPMDDGALTSALRDAPEDIHRLWPLALTPVPSSPWDLKAEYHKYGIEAQEMPLELVEYLPHESAQRTQILREQKRITSENRRVWSGFQVIWKKQRSGTKLSLLHKGTANERAMQPLPYTAMPHEPDYEPIVLCRRRWTEAPHSTWQSTSLQTSSRLSWHSHSQDAPVVSASRSRIPDDLEGPDQISTQTNLVKVEPNLHEPTTVKYECYSPRRWTRYDELVGYCHFEAQLELEYQLLTLDQMHRGVVYSRVCEQAVLYNRHGFTD